MSHLRPTLVVCIRPGLGYYATYFRVLQAVIHRRGLIHGHLENGQGRTCAIGAYFKETNVPINSRAIDEIASYNDSFPKLSNYQRWREVMAWLRFQTQVMKAKA